MDATVGYRSALRNKGFREFIGGGGDKIESILALIRGKLAFLYFPLREMAN